MQPDLLSPLPLHPICRTSVSPLRVRGRCPAKNLATLIFQCDWMAFRRNRSGHTDLCEGMFGTMSLDEFIGVSAISLCVN